LQPAGDGLESGAPSISLEPDLPPLPVPADRVLRAGRPGRVRFMIRATERATALGPCRSAETFRMSGARRPDMRNVSALRQALHRQTSEMARIIVRTGPKLAPRACYALCSNGAALTSIRQAKTKKCNPAIVSGNRS